MARLKVKEYNHTVSGDVWVPPSKYHLHRALIMGSLAKGDTTIKGISNAEHIWDTLHALDDLGVTVHKTSDGYIVKGGTYQPQDGKIWVGSSGSTLQFMLGLGCLSQNGPVTYDGEIGLRNRPIGPLLDCLGDMGVKWDAELHKMPVTIYPNRPKGGHVQIQGTLSQWISGLLMLAPFASEETVIEALPPNNEQTYIELTLQMMRRFGIQINEDPKKKIWRVPPNQEYQPRDDIEIEADLSSAAFILVLSALHPADLTLRGIYGGGTHPERDILDILQKMGVPMDLNKEEGILRIQHDGMDLKGDMTINMQHIPDLIPAICVLASLSKGTTVLKNIDHGRMKESNRVQAMLQLNKMGAKLKEVGNDLYVEGVDELHGEAISSFNDHRVQMAFALAGTRAKGATTLNYPFAYRISYPEFIEHMNTLGIEIGVIQQETSKLKLKSAESSKEKTKAMEKNPLKDIPLILDQLKAADPKKTGIIDISGSQPMQLTFSELDKLSSRVAQNLIDRGIKSGDYVAYLLPNSWEFVVLSLAIWKTGAAVCPLLPALREREISFILNRSKSPVLIVQDEIRNFEYQPLIEKIKKEIPALKSVTYIDSSYRDPADTKHNMGGMAAKDYDAKVLAERNPGTDAKAQLLFTSGTTGEPKGVVHTHGTLAYGAQSHIRTLGLPKDDNIWIPSPMAHQTGFLYGTYLALYRNATQICQDKWKVETARKAIERYNAKFVQAATPFLADMSRDPNPPKGLDIFVATGAAVPRQLAHDAIDKLGCKVVGGWGSTESCLVTVGDPQNPTDEMWNSDGKVIEGMEMKVTDEDGIELPAGKEGHYKVKTPAMFIEYLGHPEWYEDKVDEDGFFATGDLAIIDEKGYLHITGRTKDIINRGGVKIPVTEVENILYKHDAIKDVAVVGMPDPRLNERICAMAVLNEGHKLSFEEMTGFLKGQGVTKIYWPERLEILDGLPMTVTGKVQKYVLREWIAKKLKDPEFSINEEFHKNYSGIGV